MIKLVTVPKEYKGHVGVIQENALRSWLRLLGPEAIMVFGKDHTVLEMGHKYGIRVVLDVACNEYGTPYLHHIFGLAATAGGTDLIAYVNADCILDSHFLKGVTELLSLRGEQKRFLLSAQRVNIVAEELIDFADPDVAKVLEYKINSGVQDSKSAMDVFVFPPVMVDSFPPFLVGRPGWDQWFIWQARNSGASVIDATETFRVIHQSHDYRHVEGGWREACLGAEAVYNRRLASGNQADLAEARTHILRDGRLEPISDLPANENEYVEERICYYISLVGRSIDQGEYETALDYLDMLLVLGKDAIPHVQQTRALCFLKLNRILEAKSAIVLELQSGAATSEAMELFSVISEKMVTL